MEHPSHAATQLSRTLTSMLTDQTGLITGKAAVRSIKIEQEERNEQHFKTDHLLPNLKRHTISSGAVTISAQGAKFLLNVASTMILARLLLPWDFGLVAMVTTVTGFLRVFKDAGLSVATVQREKITHAQVSNLFWINVAVSFLSSLIVAVSAPVIAWFYRDSRLISITLLLSITFIISGATVQHRALLNRQMRFKALALIEVGSMAVGVLVGVAMALEGCRYWALVGSNLSMEIAGLLLTWSLSRLQFYPQRYRSTFLRLFDATALTSFAFTGLFLALARPITLVFLGPKWEQAAVVFGGLTVAALCVPLGNVCTWLFFSQGRGRDTLIAFSLNACVMILSFIAGLPYGPVGVAIAFSASSLLIRMPILYSIIGRRGPVRTADLWRVFFRHLPVWVVIFVATWLTRSMVADLRPLTQLLICAPVGALIGGAYICAFRPQRQVAIHLLDSLRELKKKR